MSMTEHASNLDVIRVVPYNAETPEPFLAHEITPSENAYVRTNFGVPVLDATHEIVVHGAVHHPTRIAVDTLRAMAQHTVTATMECAGNDRLGMVPLPTGEPWRHGALSTLVWRGVPLADVLTAAGLATDAQWVLITAADAGEREDAEGDVRFARALPIAEAMRRDTVLALEMNGAPLTPDHGAPVRLAVPGWYGMASVKWVTSIEVLREPFDGYFQRQRYVYETADDITPVSTMRVKSIIASPFEGATVAREVTVRGWAWSGEGTITRVEIAVDGGTAWHDATLGVATSAHAWTPWQHTVTFPRGGRFVLRVRATDSAGHTQPNDIVWNRLGYGNNAVRQTIVLVE
ncbi:MAG: sulfite oxidase [Gemmatimonadaceae bacterium]|nr:sulfite oxidase [Gemmatimonadaceae bacterium]